MRAWIAITLVRYAASTIDKSYSMYVRIETFGSSAWSYKSWNHYMRIVNRIVIPLAQKIDKENAVTQMIEESWWG